VCSIFHARNTLALSSSFLFLSSFNRRHTPFFLSLDSVQLNLSQRHGTKNHYQSNSFILLSIFSVLFSRLHVYSPLSTYLLFLLIFFPSLSFHSRSHARFSYISLSRTIPRSLKYFRQRLSTLHFPFHLLFLFLSNNSFFPPPPNKVVGFLKE
jgi:hypothetical protein